MGLKSRHKRKKGGLSFFISSDFHTDVTQKGVPISCEMKERVFHNAVVTEFEVAVYCLGHDKNKIE